jgi:hypothetical protein
MAEYTKATPGAPTSGLYNVSDVVTDSVGVRWQAILGGVGGDERFVPYLQQRATAAPTSLATAGPETYTAAQVLTGLIVRDCAGASRSDALPTAALLVAAMKNPKVGQVVEVLVVNGSDPITEILTVGAGAGGAFDTNQPAASRIVGGGASKSLQIRITNVGTPAYVVYA